MAEKMPRSVYCGQKLGNGFSERETCLTATLPFALALFITQRFGLRKLLHSAFLDSRILDEPEIDDNFDDGPRIMKVSRWCLPLSIRAKTRALRRVSPGSANTATTPSPPTSTSAHYMICCAHENATERHMTHNASRYHLIQEKT